MIALLRLSAGPVGWAAAFCLVYALHGLGCARRWDAVMAGGGSLHRWVLLGAWALSIGATLAIALYLTGRRDAPLGHAAAALGWVGFAATLITFLPVAVVPACT
ncbi:hypothetical protein [Sphingomonas sp. VNH70]|uniref:hypothetical protein n=1 Tax=Sphingomonas silueang TaxID=3156617 RepID=UPI0032B4A075